MKKLLITIIITFFIGPNLFAHSGRTNADGCHNDYVNGGYHCHKSKEPVRKPADINSSYSIEDIKKAKSEMIHKSISMYSGNCPCPYNQSKDGKKCGKRSAYSRPGGAEPLCYDSDITNEQAEKYLQSNAGKE